MLSSSDLWADDLKKNTLLEWFRGIQLCWTTDLMGIYLSNLGAYNSDGGFTKSVSWASSWDSDFLISRLPTEILGRLGIKCCAENLPGATACSCSKLKRHLCPTFNHCLLQYLRQCLVFANWAMSLKKNSQGWCGWNPHSPVAIQPSINSTSRKPIP